MPNIKFVEFDGTEHSVDAPIGQTLLEVAQNHLIEGIIGECGGGLACATCHVYVDELTLALLPKPSETENEMLNGTFCDRTPNSRLSCQIHIRLRGQSLT